MTQKHFIVAFHSVYYPESQADNSIFALKLHSMGSIFIRQTSMSEFAPLKSIKKLRPVPVGGVITTGEEWTSFSRFLNSEFLLQCDNELMEVWVLESSLQKD